MTKFWRAGGLCLPVALVLGLLVGCAGKKTEDEDYEGGGDKGGAGAGAQLAPMKAEGKATLKGKVTFNGEAPSLPPLNVTKDEAVCTEKTNFTWVVDPAGKGVKNVFVWVRPANKDEFFDVMAADGLKDLKTEIKLDQPACAFKPHCFLLFPAYRNKEKPKKWESTGQSFLVTNEMTIAHNASVEGPLGYKANPLIPPSNPGVAIEKVMPSMTTAYKIGCTVHPWMTAWFWALEHPWAAVTAADGSFEIKDIPIPKDGKLRVVVWHEDKKWVLEGKELGEVVELKAGDATTKDFTISK